MALLDILRSAIPAVSAARAGYFAGARERARDEALAAEKTATRERQSRLDQLRQLVDEANASAASARADHYSVPKSVTPAAPHMLNTRDGYLQWDPTTGTWQPTGLHSPTRARPSENPAAIEIRRSREVRLRTKDALAATQQRLKALGLHIEDAEADVQPGDEEAKGRLGQLIQERNALLRDADSLATAIRSPRSAARYDPVQKRFRPLAGH